MDGTPGVGELFTVVEVSFVVVFVVVVVFVLVVAVLVVVLVLVLVLVVVLVLVLVLFVVVVVVVLVVVLVVVVVMSLPSRPGSAARSPIQYFVHKKIDSKWRRKCRYYLLKVAGCSLWPTG